jgi:hypothetical protein
MAAVSTLGDSPIVQPRLEAIYSSRLDFLCAYARRLGVQESEVMDVVHDAYLSLCRLEPKREIGALVSAWEPTPENIERLEAALTALLVYYLRLRSLDRVRREARGPVPLPAQAVDLNRAALLASIAVAELDAAMARLRKAGEVTEEEWTFWRWRRVNPDAPDQDFDHALAAWRIARIKSRLFAKLVAGLERARLARRESAC